MKKLLFILALFFSLPVLAQEDNELPDKPNPPKLVNDLTGKFLTPEQKAALESKLVAFDDSTSDQITIVVLDDLKGYDATDYATALGRKWGVGNKEFNNGVVVLISTGGGSGNRKAAIAVGYGLEGALPDVTTKAIIDNDIIPNFKAGNYYRGLDEATTSIIDAAQGRYTAPSGWGSRGNKKVPSIFTIIIIIIILTIIFSNSRPGGGTYVSRGGFMPWWGGGGSSGWSGGGGGWSGGGGGGFGGFGGGSFGGGGSSGSW